MKRRYSIENVVLTNLPNYASDQQQQQQYLSSALLSPPLTSPFSTDSLLSFFPQQQQLSQVSQMRPAQYYSNQEQSFLFSSSSASSSPSSSSSPPEATMRLIRKQQQQQQQQQQSQHLLHPVIESRSQSPMFDDGGGGASRSYINASAALNESDLLLQQQQQNQQQRNQLFDTAAEFERILLEQRINSLLNSFVPQNGQMQFGEIGSSYNKQFGNHLGYNHAKSRMRAVSTGSTDIIETLMAAAAAATVKSNPRSVQQQPIGTHFNSGNIKSRSAATSISSMFDNTTTTTTTAAGSPSTSALLSPLMISPNNQFNQPLLSPPVPKMVQVQLTEEEEKLAQSGSIFERRTDWSSLLSRLPISKQNAIHLRIEDDGPYGNDETRLFLLSHFSALRLKEIPCVMCSCVLVIYDRFPIVDGTLFTSPVMYDKEKSISGGSQYKGQYIHAICLKCLLGEDNHEIKCRSCQNRLNPDHIQIGTLYKFDLFAAFACCPSRLTCKACMQPLHVDEDSMSFSSYSDERQCPKCKKRTHHFIKPLNDIFLPSKCASSCSKSHQMTPHLESIADF